MADNRQFSQNFQKKFKVKLLQDARFFIQMPSRSHAHARFFIQSKHTKAYANSMSVLRCFFCRAGWN